MTETFAIVPSTARPLWVVVPVALLLLGVIALLFATTSGGRRARFEVSERGLRLRGDLYGRLIPPTSLRAAEARVVDLRAERELEPRRRTLGTAMPGYRAGWFRLRNGEKALLYVTDSRRAVYVPTTEGYSLLLSPQRPEEFLTRLREVAR